MGCAGSMALTANVRGMRPLEKLHSGGKYSFDEKQKRVIIKTWKCLSCDISGNGAKVFLRIFQLNPHVKQLFPCRHVEGAALLQDPDFKGHAARFMQAVGAVIDNIDDMEGALRDLLLGLGKQHIHFTGFKPDYFNAFQEAVVHVWQQELREKFTEYCRSAWVIIFDFIMEHLKEGYRLASAEVIDKMEV
ncbi:hypothetical protein ACJMK2_029616 [Sinanodonta woodiana]|uniref:Globin domain-containing protein n=1 Tax=Sinanodonta woodiana TaxID=1069815 RepID=A0ABD3XEE1_SINWO